MIYQYRRRERFAKIVQGDRVEYVLLSDTLRVRPCINLFPDVCQNSKRRRCDSKSYCERLGKVSVSRHVSEKSKARHVKERLPTFVL